MTTAAEIKQSLKLYPSDAQRLVFAPSGLLASSEGNEQLARDIVGLANRDGGRVVLGVDPSGRFEEKLALDFDGARAALAGLLDELTAPRVDAMLEHLVDGDGELLVVAVPRRSGTPHAVARTNARGSVGARLYCVRDRDRTMPVSDGQLRWLFGGGGGAGATHAFEFTLHVREGETGLRQDVLQPRVCEALEAFLSGLSGDAAHGLVGNPERLQQAAVELCGWAFLNDVAELTQLAGDIERAEQQLDELPVPASGSVFAEHPGGLRGLLGGPSSSGVIGRLLRRGSKRAFELPCDAEVQVDYLTRLGKARVGLTSPNLRIGFSARPGSTGAGLRWPGVEWPDQPGSHWVAVNVEVEIELPFPRTDSPATTSFELLAEAILERLRRRWDDGALHAAVSPAAAERFLS